MDAVARLDRYEAIGNPDETVTVVCMDCRVVVYTCLSHQVTTVADLVASVIDHEHGSPVDGGD